MHSAVQIKDLFKGGGGQKAGSLGAILIPVGPWGGQGGKDPESSNVLRFLKPLELFNWSYYNSSYTWHIIRSMNNNKTWFTVVLLYKYIYIFQW